MLNWIRGARRSKTPLLGVLHALRDDRLQDSLGIAALDDFLKERPRSVFPAPDRGSVRPNPSLADLQELTDPEVGHGLAALLILERVRPRPRLRAFGHIDQYIKLFLQTLGERVTWGADEAALVLQSPVRPGYQPATDPTFDVLERSFPNGLPPNVRDALRTFLDTMPPPERCLSRPSPAVLERAEIMAGRDPRDNQLLRLQDRDIEAYRAAKRKVLEALGSVMRAGFEALAEGEEAMQRWSATIPDLTPKDRAALVVDLERKINLSQMRGAHALRMQRVPMESKTSDDLDIEKVNLFYKDRDALWRKPAEYSDAQAKDLVRLYLGAREAGLNRQSPLSSHHTRKRICKAIAQPDADLAVRLAKAGSTLSCHDIIKALNGTADRAPDKAKPAYLRRYDTAREVFLRALNDAPGLWLPVAASQSGKWSRINHQIFPYNPEIQSVMTALWSAARGGADVTAETKEWRALLLRAEENLALLKAGKFTARRKSDFPANLHDGGPNSRTSPYPNVKQTEGPAFFDGGAIQVDRAIYLEEAVLLGLSRTLSSTEAMCVEARQATLPADLVAGNPGSKPTKKWVKAIRDRLSPDMLKKIVEELDQVSLDAILETDTVGHSEIPVRLQTRLVSMLWAVHLAGKDACGTLERLALEGFAKIRGEGMRSQRIGTAAITSLSMMADGLGLPSLIRIQQKVAYTTVKKRIAKLLDDAAKAQGLSKADITELATADHGLAAGERAVALKHGAAIFEVSGGKVELRWNAGTGKRAKAIPKAIREADPDGVKSVRALKKEIDGELSLWIRLYQEGYFGERWLDYGTWRTRHADHGTRSVLARQLLWLIETPSGKRVGRPTPDGLVDHAGSPIDTKGGRMRLWHPLDSAADETSAWQSVFWDSGLQQPFRQVWRESYRLTDAERETASYSNRFAGHVVHQHRVMALGTANNWQSTHRMGHDVSNDEPMHILLPDVGLQAEFWTKPIAPGSPMTHRGSYLYLTTDRVQFHQLDRKACHGRGEVVALEDVPERTFSEVMRHCDLFTSVASISLDPEWEDAGPDAEHPNSWRGRADAYWRDSQAMGLTGTSMTRREILARVIPGLKISPKLQLEDAFLTVDGDHNTYRIHLGSAAVIIKEKNRHVCIVPELEKPSVVLPIHEDKTLSVILSKAFLLANDTQIKDETILKQLIAP